MLKRNSLTRLTTPQHQKREMSIQQSSKKTETDVKLITHTARSDKFHILTKGVQAPESQLKAESNLLWAALLVNPVGIKKKHLIFKSIEYIISNWSSDQFPNVIYITADGVDGYKDVSQTTTTRVAALQLQSVTAVMDQSQVRTYELRYVNRDPQTWEVPITLVNIALRVCIDDATLPIIMPLPSPISLNFQIRTE